MHTIVSFPESTEVATPYVVAAATGIANTETDAITILNLDADQTTVASIGSNTQATMYIKFTKGSLTSTTIRIYGSYLRIPTSADWYQEVVETDSTGVATLDPFSIVISSTAQIAYHFPIGAYKALKITVASTGTITNSAITLNVGLR